MVHYQRQRRHSNSLRLSALGSGLTVRAWVRIRSFSARRDSSELVFAVVLTDANVQDPMRFEPISRGILAPKGYSREFDIGGTKQDKNQLGQHSS